MQAAEGEGGAVMSTTDPRPAGRQEAERRKDAAHDLLEARREVYILRARRALLAQLLFAGTATADDVAEQIGSTPEGSAPVFSARFRGCSPVPASSERRHSRSRPGRAGTPAS
jgi:hypothetical protein